MPLHRLVRVLSSFTVVAVLTACGDISDTPEVIEVDIVPPTTSVVVKEEVVVLVGLVERNEQQRGVLRWLASFGEYVAAVAKSQVRAEPGVRSRPPAATAATPGLEPCGGDLPPCWVARRESGGSYTAYNPTGCGGRGCFGKWQFSGEWAGKLGLPLDLSTATPEQQDNAARELWRQGAGCSNWAAC